jgi:hypothetical protein
VVFFSFITAKFLEAIDSFGPGSIKRCQFVVKVNTLSIDLIGDI